MLEPTILSYYLTDVAMVVSRLFISTPNILFCLIRYVVFGLIFLREKGPVELACNRREVRLSNVPAGEDIFELAPRRWRPRKDSHTFCLLMKPRFHEAVASLKHYPA